jgi:UDP-N-acetylglucosamine 2-epimerase (non-hydrolysing)
MYIAFILGTRPEIIKMAPVIAACNRQAHRNLEYFILHTGQHYSYALDKVFFEQLALPDARYNLDVGSGTHAEQTGKIMMGIERVLHAERPDIILVEGDTNTVLAGALVAAKLHIRVGHIEAGLRSHDWMMPEEVNRVLTDHCSNLLFAPTNAAKQNLVQEGLSATKIFVTGNTIVDAVQRSRRLSHLNTSILDTLNIAPKKYFLVTAHRQENVDDRTRLSGIIRGLEQITQEFHQPVVFPIHPRTKKMMKTFNITSKEILFIEPVDHLSFLQLESHARLVLTDSGGIQEETCILGIPCVTLRENTERPETLTVGSNTLAGTNPDRILQSVNHMLAKTPSWQQPFGDGHASQQIIDIVLRCD